MAFTTFGGSAAAVTTVPTAGMRRSSASYAPGLAVPLTVFSGAPSTVAFSPRMAQAATAVTGLAVGESYYLPGSGWRPGYRLPGGDAPTNGTQLYDSGTNANNGGLVFGTMRGREGSLSTYRGNTTQANFVPNAALQEFSKPYQYLPVLNAVPWSATFRMNFPTGDASSGSATPSSSGEGVPCWSIPMNRAGSSQTYAKCVITAYSNSGTYRQVQWQFQSDFSGATGNLTTGGGIITFSGGAFIDWTLSFTVSGGLSVTMTPSNGTAGTAALPVLGSSPADLAVCFGGFYPNVYSPATYGIDNLTITTGLSD